MASNFKLSTASRNAAVNGIVDQLDAATATCAIRDGAPPTNPSDASTGNLLATLNFNVPAFGAGAAGVATMDNTPNPSATAVYSADAGYFRAYPNGAADAACAFQGTAGNAADSPDMVFDNKTIVSGGTVAISAFTLTVPEQ